MAINAATATTSARVKARISASTTTAATAAAADAANAVAADEAAYVGDTVLLMLQAIDLIIGVNAANATLNQEQE